MPTYVVPLDGSEFAERALRPAVALAARHAQRGTPARVLLLTCTWPDDPPPERRLADRAALLGDVADIDVRVLEGVDPAEGILQTVAALPDAVAFMATHGHGGLRSAVLGSVAERVLCHAPRPVVLVGPAARSTVLPGERGRLVVCSDGSAFAESVLPTAARWVGGLGFEPWLVEVITPDEDVHEPGEPSVVELRAAAEARLRALADRFGSGAQQAQTEVLYGTPASRAISAFAADLPAALVAVASHGRTGVLRSALGSVATELVRQAPCPVLVHRPTEDDAGDGTG